MLDLLILLILFILLVVHASRMFFKLVDYLSGW